MESEAGVVVNCPNKTLPLASGALKGSVGILYIAASELGVPPNVQEEPESSIPADKSKPTYPTVLGISE